MRIYPGKRQHQEKTTEQAAQTWRRNVSSPFGSSLESFINGPYPRPVQISLSTGGVQG